MPTLLQLDSAANRGGESHTRRLTAAYAQAWLAANPCGRHVRRDLAVDPVEPIDTAYCALGRRSERRGTLPLDEVPTIVASPGEARAWALTRVLVDEVLGADVLLLGAPMYNFGVAAALKAWIDRVSFPGLRLDGLRVVVVTSHGGEYADGDPRDHVVPYLRAWLGRLGATDVEAVSVDLALADLAPHLAHRRADAAASLATASARVRALAVPVPR